MKECAVVIPCYKEQLNKNETIAIMQCLKILGDYDVFIISPKGLVNDWFDKVNGVEFFDNSWFKSRDTYSAFMLKGDLYKRFDKYRFVLIYQLDAFVFRNELEYFCELGYDYIGAPWPTGVLVHGKEKSKVIRVGNGGLSLRNTETFVDWTKRNENQIDYFIKEQGLGEDFIIGFIGNMKIAPYDIAERFSVEVLTQEIVNNKDKLPFGAHNIAAYDFELSKQLYSDYGYNYERPKVSFIINNDINNFWNREKRLFEGDFFDKNIKEIIESYFGHFEDVTIWGIGKIGTLMINVFARNKMSVFKVLETTPATCLKNGHKIEKAETCIKNKEFKNLILCFKKTIEAEELLKQYGYKRRKDYITYEDIVDRMYEKAVLDD